jgi:hypothetical protein
MEMTASMVARAGLLVATLSLAGASAQAAMSPFRAMAGSWAGGGVIDMANGDRERLRCRASYDVDGSGSAMRLNLRCASDSYNFDLASNLEYRGGEISGEWTEASRNASGTIEGRATGDHIEAAATRPGFSANLSLTTRGSRQMVTIRPQGSDISAVSLELNRR